MTGWVSSLGSGARRLAWWLLLGGVLLGHGLLLSWLHDRLPAWAASQASLRRIEVAFVRTLAPSAPAPPPRPHRALAPMHRGVLAAASSELLGTAAVDIPAVAPELAASAPAADAASAAAPDAPGFEWPPSTRLSYVLSGYFRGEVQGRARVQWVRLASHYQVHLDIEVGPSFAPLIWRRVTSDGELGAQGLSPRRYDEATRPPFKSPRRLTMAFTPDSVTLADGRQEVAPPGLQDSASQFVQLTWLFTTQPRLLREGGVVTVPLALPRRVGAWVYDVLGTEVLSTPVGEVEAFHLKPRPGSRHAGDELIAEVWIAPSLQYLPVRIRVQHDAETFIDLQLESAPLQAEPGPGGARIVTDFAPTHPKPRDPTP